MFKQAVEFIKTCKGKTIIVYDIDGDGIGAAVILSKTLRRLFKLPKAIPGNHDLKYITNGKQDELSKKKPDNIIFVDMSLDKKLKYILKLAKKYRILIIDHHQTKKNLNRNKNIVHVNPEFWKSKIPPFRYVTSKLAFDICKKVTDIEDLDWVAGVGIVGDYAGASWKSFLNKIYKKYPYLKGKDLYSFGSKLGYINNLITSGYFYSRMDGRLGYKACLEAESPLDIIKLKNKPAKKLKRMYNQVEREIQYTVKNWKKLSEINEDKKLIILMLKTKFAIHSPISTKVSIKKPNYTVIVARKHGKHIHISFRRQDRKVDCGRLARLSTKNLKNANGGGHIPAAGGNIMSKDWNKFKNNVIKIL